ncbi:MAG TPA: hypothetical protein VEY13_11730 [Rubrobacteraceae bacterium]|nr:hypothetical protein [Rubrobacteraceae bacterium]
MFARLVPLKAQEVSRESGAGAVSWWSVIQIEDGVGRAISAGL